MANDFLGDYQAQKLDNGLDRVKFTHTTSDDTRAALSMQAFSMPEDNHARNLAIAGGAGLAVGAAGTAAGEVAMMKLVAEPIGNGLGRTFVGLAETFTGRSLGWAPQTLKLAQCITPKNVLIGSLVTAGLAVGCYELYEHLKK